MKLYPRHIFVIVVFFGIFYFSLGPIVDPDFWWHLQTGKFIVDNLAIPHTDLFSYTAIGNEWIAHEWLTEALIYLLYSKMGIVSLIAFFSLIITAAYGFSYLRSSPKSKPYIAGFLLILSAVASAPLWGVRPQMISLLLMSLFIYLLDDYEKSQRLWSLIPLPILMVIWVNLHGGFMLGIGIVGVYITGHLLNHLFKMQGKTNSESSFWRPGLYLSGTFFMCVLAALINPNHFKILVYPFQTLFDPAMQQYLMEWYSPDFHMAIWIPFGLLVLLLIGVGLVGHKSVSITNILLVLLTCIAAFRSVRHIPLFAIVVSPILGDLISQIINIPVSNLVGRKFIQWINAGILLVVLVFSGLAITQLAEKQRVKELEVFPSGAVAWMLENQPDGEMFNSYTWGGYLIWKLHPDYLVYIDGRPDMYGSEFVDKYANIYFVKTGWEEGLAQTNARIVLVERDSLLDIALRQTQKWTIIYEDDLSVIFHY